MIPAELSVLSLTCQSIAHSAALPVENLSAGVEWLELLQPAAPEMRDRSGALVLNPGNWELVAFGPYWTLPPGRYEVAFEFDFKSTTKDQGPLLFAEVFSEGAFRATKLINIADVATEQSRLMFEVHEYEGATGRTAVEVRLRAVGAPSGGSVRSVRVRRIGDAVQSTPWTTFPDPETNWLPFLIGGPAFKIANGVVAATGKSKANVLYGPYWQLSGGSFLGIFEIAVDSSGRAETVGTIDIVADGEILAEVDIDASATSWKRFALPFTLDEQAENTIETRVWTKGTGSFRVRSVRIEKA